ncbi:MAG: hypothetical protein LBC95_01790 [Candidatus Nomurabacteria bacterium]|jgi:hypothetical protein|nr:hypothetical protein [Candidatus Nomurabacteria bacterium]
MTKGIRKENFEKIEGLLRQSCILLADSVGMIDKREYSMAAAILDDGDKTVISETDAGSVDSIKKAIDAIERRADRNGTREDKKSIDDKYVVCEARKYPDCTRSDLTPCALPYEERGFVVNGKQYRIFFFAEHMADDPEPYTATEKNIRALSGFYADVIIDAILEMQ